MTMSRPLMTAYHNLLSVPALALVAAALAGGCAAQVTPSYQGEALATVRGNLVTLGSEVSADTKVAIVWLAGRRPVGDAGSSELDLLGSTVAVRGNFPAQFTISVFTPPPADAVIVRGDFDGGDPAPSGEWLGYLAALRADADESNLKKTDIVGTDPDHVVVYYDHDVDVPPNDTSGVPGTKGYHLIKIDHGTPDEQQAYRQCLTGGICVRDTGSAWADWEYAHCLKQMPSAETCETSSPDCLDRAEKSRKSDTECNAPYAFRRPPNPADLRAPVTIVIGKTLWDAMML